MVNEMTMAAARPGLSSRRARMAGTTRAGRLESGYRPEVGRRGGMIRFDAFGRAARMAGAVAGTAFAGDLPPEIKMPEVSVKDARGWYVRGDLGYAVNASHNDTTFRAYDPTSGDYSSSRFDS